MEITINLNKPLLNLSGLPVENGDTLGRLLASSLAVSQEGNPLKMNSWAMTLWAGKPIKVDKADAEYIEKFVRGSQHQLTNMIKAQILEIISEAEKGK